MSDKLKTVLNKVEYNEVTIPKNNSIKRYIHRRCQSFSQSKTFNKIPEFDNNEKIPPNSKLEESKAKQKKFIKPEKDHSNTNGFSNKQNFTRTISEKKPITKNRIVNYI